MYRGSFFAKKTANTNFIVFNLIRLGFEPTIKCTRGDHGENIAQLMMWSVKLTWKD
jgi:hypothetical protein